jgi:tetraacyldisaccharide 4'-kinase
MVLFLAELLQERGKKVVISCNGYGSSHQGGATVAPLGSLDAAEWGDEPSLLRETLPDVPMIVGRERTKAAKIAEELFADHILLLDDGLQHLPIGKDLQIVMLPPDLSNQNCFPAGPFRQPANDSYRFDVVLPGRDFQVRTVSQLRLPEGIRSQELYGMRVQLLTAIARPERLMAAVEPYEFSIVNLCLLRDHHPLSDGTLLQQFDPELPILITEKDWVKLRCRPDVDQYTFWVLEHRSSVEPRSAFGDWIHRELEKKHSARLSRS